MNDISMLSLQNLLKNKLTCLTEMLELTKQQSCAIKNEEIEQLDTLIDKKSNLITKIDLLDYEFKETIRDTLIEDNSLSEIKTQTKEMLKQIKTLDDENNQNLSIALTDMKLNLKDVRQGQRAMKNYGNADPYQSFVSQGGTLFIDQDS